MNAKLGIGGIKLLALVISVLAWYPIAYSLDAIMDGLGIPVYDKGPTTKLEWNRDTNTFDEEVSSGHGTGAGDYWIVLSVLLSRVMYKLIDRRTPISRKEKRWYVYISVGYAIWAFSGDWLHTPLDTFAITSWMSTGAWLDTPLDPRIRIYALQRLLHWLIGAGVVGACRWDYLRTFSAKRDTTDADPVDKPLGSDISLGGFGCPIFLFVIMPFLIDSVFGILMFINSVLH